MKTLNESECTETHGGKLFGQLLGAAIGGAIGFATGGPVGMVVCAGAGAFWGDSLQDRINGENTPKSK